MAGLSQENKLRDVFNAEVVESFANRIYSNFAEFNKTGFVADISPNLDKLGFIERSNLIRDILAKYLPSDFPEAAKILVNSLDKELNFHGVTNWDSFIVMPQTAFISKYGKKYFEISVNALYEMTKRFTAEGDLRTFIEIDFEGMMEILHRWCNDKSPHVRRLVSEGTRPRLPLAGRIRRFQKNPIPVIELLDKLRNDPEIYVRRSVANNMNDIAKDNPEIAIKTLRNWKNQGCDWVVKHAARSLVKQKNQEIMEILGFTRKPDIEVSKISMQTNEVKIGERIRFEFIIKALGNANLVVDFVIHYIKSNGKKLPKVFKLKNLSIKFGENVKIRKEFQIRNTSGRKIYHGAHILEIQINGKIYDSVKFLVI